MNGLNGAAFNWVWSGIHSEGKSAKLFNQGWKLDWASPAS